MKPLSLTFFTLLSVFIGVGQYSARERASLAGVVINVDTDEVLVAVTVRVTRANCEFDCAPPRYHKTNDNGQFYFVALPNASYVLDVIGTNGTSLLHREVIKLPMSGPVVIRVSPRFSPHNRRYSP